MQFSLTRIAKAKHTHTDRHAHMHQFNDLKYMLHIIALMFLCKRKSDMTVECDMHDICT